MVWLVIVLAAVVVFLVAWWLSGRARPERRGADGHAAVRAVQGRTDDLHMWRRPGQD